MEQLLLVPPLNTQRGGLPSSVSYGLYSLHAVAQQSGGGVDVLSFASLPPPEASRVTTPLPRRFANSEDMASAVADRIDTGQYAAVGLSTMCGSFHHSLNLVGALKRRSPDTRIWLGGPHASISPETLLGVIPEVEAVFVGESEDTFGELLERRARTGVFELDDLPGVCIRGSGFVPRKPIPELDRLPFMDDSPGFLPAVKASMEAGLGKALPVEVERGCPGYCSFCSTSSYWGRRVRMKSPGRLIAEMQRLHNATGIVSFTFEGDNVAGSHARLLEFCETMRTEAPEYRWTGQIKLDKVDSSDLEALWAGGCRGFFVGVESASQETLDRIGKGVDLERELRMIYEALTRGFQVTTSLIVGFPWESREDLFRTYRLHHELLERGVYLSSVTALCPLPGTELVRQHADAIRPRIGLSFTAKDDMPYGRDTIGLMDRCPELFTQLGYFETGATWEEVAAITNAAFVLTSHYRSNRGGGPDEHTSGV